MSSTTVSQENSNQLNGRNDAPETASEKLASQAHEKIDQVAESAAAVESTARAKVADANRKAKDIGAKTQEQGEELAATAKKAIAENPLAAAGAAFAAGFILSAILRR